MSFSIPPLLSELASALRTLRCDRKLAVALLRNYGRGSKPHDRAEAEWCMAATIGEIEAAQICNLAGVFVFNEGPRADIILALRNKTIANGCTPAEADSAATMADKLAAMINAV